jgi:Fe-S-cluster containining protein
MSCLSCGACCAAFRVDFHRSDLANAAVPGVPEALTVPLTATLVRMRGSDEAAPRCVALEGAVGQCVRCTIYEQRPGPCRDFAPYAPLGIGDDACDRARRRHGLAPLAL